MKLPQHILDLNPELKRVTEPLEIGGSRYRSKLEERVATEWILTQQPDHWLYEPMSLNLGKKVSYKPDFLLMWDAGHLPLMVEAKGYTKSLRADEIRFRLAAERFPCFRWLWLEWSSDCGWIEIWDK